MLCYRWLRHKISCFLFDDGFLFLVLFVCLLFRKSKSIRLDGRIWEEFGERKGYNLHENLKRKVIFLKKKKQGFTYAKGHGTYKIK